MENNSLISFEGQSIRKVWYNNEWYFSVVDVIGVLTDSPQPSRYWNAIKKKDEQLFAICEKLKLEGLDGRSRLSDCSNTEGVFRITMSVPSPKAEPLKLWRAQMGKQAIDEAENPELLTERQADLYRAKGYSEEWTAY